MGEAPLKIRVILRNLWMKNEHTHKFPFISLCINRIKLCSKDIDGFPEKYYIGA